jgi:hypothetical protein
LAKEDGEEAKEPVQSGSEAPRKFDYEGLPSEPNGAAESLVADINVQAGQNYISLASI